MSAPATDYYEHPVFHPDRLQLDTYPIKMLGETLHRWLWTGATGGLITGPARVGKTTAVRRLAGELRTRAGTLIPSAYVSIPKRDQPTIASVFRQLCWAIGLTVSNRDQADHLSDRYVHELADRAAAASCPSVVLLVDEVQRLQPHQFNAFAEVYDKLLLLGVTLTVIFVGNDQESSPLLARIEQRQNAHIRGRFFTHWESFGGLTSRKQVSACLAQYDTLHFPQDGPSYTGFFLPEAVRDGWRLASLDGDLWRVFREYQSNYHIASWGMQHFTVTVNTLLTDFLPQYGVEQIDDDMIHECIALSGLIPSLVGVSP